MISRQEADEDKADLVDDDMGCMKYVIDYIYGQEYEVPKDPDKPVSRVPLDY